MTIEQISRPTVANFIWVDDRPAEGLALAAAARPAAVLAAAHGQFALVEASRGGELVLARDALGVNKLFFGLKSDGAFDWSNYWADLLDRGFAPEEIWSVPSGHYAVLDRSKRSLDLTKFANLRFNDADRYSQDDIATQAARVRERLARVFEHLRELAVGRALYVTLSGGLDSATVAGWSDSRWTPGMARARQRAGRAEPFIDVVARAVESLPGEDLAAGARVFHQKFGYGTVRKVEGERLTIGFDRAGDKKVMASFVVPEDQAG